MKGPQNGRKYLQNVDLRKDSYAEYIKSSDTSTERDKKCSRKQALLRRENPNVHMPTKDTNFLSHWRRPQVM
jgi:hypothetical protein